MADYLVSRTISSVLSIPLEEDSSAFRTYNIFMDQASGHCILHRGKVVNIDTLEPAKDKAFIEAEILCSTIAMNAFTNQAA
ncbi:MAG: hypothetical protein Q8O24_07205 [Gallionellaceae bacterium]|nr:hypothetical protein [Gallionellaceae bacterium]